MSSEKHGGIDEQPSVTKSGELVLIEKHEETETMSNKEAKEGLTPEELRHQKEREYTRKYYQKNKEKIKNYGKEYYQKNKEKLRAKSTEYYLKNKEELLTREHNYYRKNRERISAKRKARYHSDPKYRAENRERSNKLWERRKEAFKERFLPEYGGKCVVCGESDPDVLDVHHPNGRREDNSFIMSKEFTLWLKYGIKPNVVLMDAKCHTKLHRTEYK